MFLIRVIFYCCGTFLFIAPLINFISKKISDIKNPSPGSFVYVNNKKIHYIDKGGSDDDGPVIVVISGCGCNLLPWISFQDSVSKFARTIIYDRAGLGWSDWTNSPKTAINVAAELKIFLKELSIDKNIILVGHSLGGLYARVFASIYSRMVVGIVLVDPMTEFMNYSLEYGILDEWLRSIRLLKTLTFFGLHHFVKDKLSKVAKLVLNNKIKETFSFRIIKLMGLSEFFYNEICARELEVLGMEPSVVELKLLRNKLEDKPLVVVTADNKIQSNEVYWSEWRAVQARLLLLSSKSSQVFAKNSDHEIVLWQPELIVSAVKQVLNQAPKA